MTTKTDGPAIVHMEQLLGNGGKGLNNFDMLEKD
jgi:hypothetical protein